MPLGLLGEVVGQSKAGLQFRHLAERDDHDVVHLLRQWTATERRDGDSRDREVKGVQDSTDCRRNGVRLVRDVHVDHLS